MKSNITFGIWKNLADAEMEPVRKKKKTNNNTRFILYSDKEIEEKRKSNKNRNTTKSEERANSAFQKFLSQCGKTDLEYWLYDEEELDSMLSKFWFGAQKDADSEEDTDTEDPKKTNLMYSANTMKNFRYALNRILKNKGHLYDIMSKATLSFKHSQQAFLDSQKELKELGKAEIKSAPEITEDGKKLALRRKFQ